ncbi:hypothetical protein C5B94_11635 [Clavibacter michiganensis]|uniref:DUF2510 domain-containing protein n=1 Tax=Clavibacter michiganensis TaxID=28447 RepID=UPI000CE82EF7|nr:DUF2510 domain-containing protein [Clavibacter michiganensis]PPF52724.1 hypothetical protein C5B94_11635 [Clavibacter michiganensis]
MATDAQAGWYDDGSATMRWWDGARWTEHVMPPTPPVPPASPVVAPTAAVPAASIEPPAGVAGHAVATATSITRPVTGQGGATTPTRTDSAVASGQAYVVLQIILKEKLWGTGSGNLTELEHAINEQAAKGYRLHTISTASSGSKGLGGGDRIQATLVFERLG